ncbi:MAG: hypothetical protein AB4040_11505 [Synechococcus sp.]
MGGYDFDPGSNVVDVHFRNLRKKIEGRSHRDGAGTRVTISEEAIV